jgi:hypothetical protein
MNYQKALYTLFNLVALRDETITISMSLMRGCLCGRCMEYVIEADGEEILRDESIERIAETLSNFKLGKWGEIL